MAIDTPGLALLFLLTASYLLFGAPFAELHIELFQAIPVFVGEIVLTICLFLFSFRCFVSGPGVRQPVILSWIMFGFWILGKAVTGYFETKGYALRNAALFYYPFTALFVYVFAKDLVGRRKGLGDLFREPRLSLFFYFLGIFLALGQSVVMMEPFGRYSCLAVLAGFFLSFGRIWWVMGGLLVVLVGGIVAGALDCASRAHFISLLCASIFLVVYFFMAGRARKRIKWIVGVFSCLLLAAFIVSRSDPHTVKSLVTPGELFKLYQGFEERLQKEGSFYVAQPKEARIYNPDSAGFRARWFRPTGEPLNEDKASLPESGEVQESVLATTREPPQQEPRSLGIAYGNMLFRYYIWRDMTEEFFKERPFLFGFSFGKPQRSRSVEVLNWASGEWSRDGWIAPHNSFLHLIYRGGLVGLGVIFVMLGLLARMLSIFVSARSSAGACLVSVLLFGLVTANFSVFLELPYTAIPFWFLFGLTGAFARNVKKGFCHAGSERK